MNTCLDCDQQLKTHYSKRCKSCSAKKRVVDRPDTVFPKGDKHYAWKGKDAKYTAIHMWIYKQFGQPNTCEECGKSGLTGKFINWANISGKYLRARNDWKRLCKPCHAILDNIGMRSWVVRRQLYGETGRRQILR